jgi:hypothetical protein
LIAQIFHPQATQNTACNVIIDIVLRHISPSKSGGDQGSFCGEITNAPCPSGVNGEIAADSQITAIALQDLDVIEEQPVWESLPWVTLSKRMIARCDRETSDGCYCITDKTGGQMRQTADNAKRASGLQYVALNCAHRLDFDVNLDGGEFLVELPESFTQLAEWKK